LNNKERETEIKKKLRKIKKLIRGKNKSLSTKTGMDYDEYLGSPDYTENQQDEEIVELCKTIMEYREIRDELEEQLDELQKEKVAHIFNNQEPEENDA
jgi:hypothetical protein